MRKQKGNISGDALVFFVCLACVPFIFWDVLTGRSDFTEPCHKSRCIKREVMEYHNKKGTTPSKETQYMMTDY